jgi:hypothetical protein
MAQAIGWGTADDADQGTLRGIALNKLRRHHEGLVVLAPVEAAALLALIEKWHWERT